MGYQIFSNGGQWRQTPNEFMHLPHHGGQQAGFPFPGWTDGGSPFHGGAGQGGFPFPGGGHGQQGFPFPGGGQQAGAPTTLPPAVIPQESAGIKAVDPGAIRGCLYRFTYIWLNNGRSFWLYPTYVGRTSVAGFRWRRYRWEYYGTDLRRIRSFRCYY
ncbi:hypothetical protein ACF5W4_18160 [Bacillota bacterium Lsc_1132]